MTNQWDRQADETDEWYDRFALYLYMGSNRTLAAAHAFAARLAKGAAHGHLNSWRRVAAKYQWRERAAAYDAAGGGRQTRRDGSVGERTSERTDDERLRMVVELLRQVYGVLRQAELATLTREEARQSLPTLRLFFRDLLRLYQSEAAQMAASNEAGGAMLSADDFLRLIAESDEVRSLLADLARANDSMANEAWWQPLRDVLAQLYPDEASARRIAAQAHLDSTRIHFAPRAVDGWHAILTEAAHTGLMEGVIAATQAEYGANRDLIRAIRHYRQARTRTETKREAQGKRPDSKKPDSKRAQSRRKG
jgi:hypothetical protein